MKAELGQFYTKNSDYIIGNLLNDFKGDIEVVEPFCGEGDLIFFKNTECYDIEPKIEKSIMRDTLLYPPNYTNKYVMTNPPYLARNKSKNKEIFDKWLVDDLYKAFIKSIENCKGGILIIPLNFLSDRDDKIREYFFNRFEIIKLNIFEESVFDDTSYTVISFSFKRRVSDKLEIKCKLFPSEKVLNFAINKNNGYKIGEDYFSLINSISNKESNKIKRLLLEGEGSNNTPNSNIFLRSVDTGSMDGRISLSLQDHYYGKSTDRVFSTLILDKDYTIEEQERICNIFNNILEEFRKKYNSLFLTNYRNSTSAYARKRISFREVNKLIVYIIKNKMNN